MIKGGKNEDQIQAKSNCASSVCVQTNAPRARWGSTPIPFDITGETGDELSGIMPLDVMIENLKTVCLRGKENRFSYTVKIAHQFDRRPQM